MRLTRKTTLIHPKGTCKIPTKPIYHIKNTQLDLEGRYGKNNFEKYHLRNFFFEGIGAASELKS